VTQTEVREGSNHSKPIKYRGLLEDEIWVLGGLGKIRQVMN